MFETASWDASLIVPLLKRAGATGYGDPPQWRVPQEDLPISELLTTSLLVCYVFDLPESFVYVSERHCARLALKAEDLRPLAVQNLIKRRGFPQIRRAPTAVMLNLDGSLESSLLLVDQLWAQIAPHLAGQIVKALLIRDGESWQQLDDVPDPGF